MEIVAKLQEIVGSENVSTSEAICQSYAYSCFLSNPDIPASDTKAKRSNHKYRLNWGYHACPLWRPL